MLLCVLEWTEPLVIQWKDNIWSVIHLLFKENGLILSITITVKSTKLFYLYNIKSDNWMTYMNWKCNKMWIPNKNTLSVIKKTLIKIHFLQVEWFRLIFLVYSLFIHHMYAEILYEYWNLLNKVDTVLLNYNITGTCYKYI